jgi:uncharacterized protein (DUF2141 family)
VRRWARPLLALLLAPAFLNAGQPASAASLSIVVDNVSDASGHVLVALCTEQTFLGAGCSYVGKAPAAPGEVTIVFPGILPGTYAVQAFHDANDNLDIDRTFIGYPKEGMGFGNDAPMRFGPPTFADAAVVIGEADVTTRLSMRYFSLGSIAKAR